MATEEDITMLDSVHPHFQQELLAASSQSSRTTPRENEARSPSHQAAHATLSNDGPTDAVGINALGHKVKDLVRAMDKLQQLGIETTDLPLPKIVVVGDQSAGKSSLIEGISGIKVPRASGTCTRCPLQITLTAAPEPAAKWVCRITLQKKYSLYSTASTGADASPYGRWHADAACDEIFFVEVYNTHDLEEALRRAQVATLNPGANPQQYLNAADIDKMDVQIDFSPNPIRLDITGPGLPNLSFFDLPGIINQTEEPADIWLVNLVKTLVTDYINQESSLILLACSMEGDLQNSSASALIAGCEGANERTVAVLTKPDRFPEGNPWGTVQKILNNMSFRVGHGYYVTKQLSQLQLDGGVTYDEARAAETEFFAAAPWSTVFAAHHARFGTAQLRAALSQKLTHQILVSLPTINEKVSRRLTEVEAELTCFPDPPTNALSRCLESLSKFDSLVERQIEGIHPANDLRNIVKGFSAAFQKGLIDQRPTLMITTPPGYAKADAVTINLLSDDDSDGDSRAQSPVEFRTPGGKKRKIDPDVTPQVKKQPSQPSYPRSILNTRIAKKKFTLLEIRDTLERLCMSDIPNEVDPRAVDHLRSQSLASWQVPTELYLNQITKSLQETMEKLLREACEQWITTDFFKESLQIVTTFTATAMDEQRLCARRALRLELHKPSTMNREGLAAQKSDEYRILSEARYHKRALEHLQRTDRSLRGLNEEDRKIKEQELLRKAKTDSKLRSELGADPFQREVDVMASVRGYYNVALLRFLDHVVQGVQAEAFAKCRTELPAQMRAGLMVESPDAQSYCNRLLAEDPTREIRRLQLKKERDNLLEARQWLAGLHGAQP